MGAVRASIVIPTRARPDYLKVALASIAPQAGAAGAELIVVDDAGPTEDARRLAERFGARYEPHPGPLGLNVARNTGVERSGGELIVFVDDDVEACQGWLAALLAAADEHPQVEVFAGAILPRLEGRPPRSCGREGPPVTSLQLGPDDRETRYAWGANMATRRRAFERFGSFDTSLVDGGDEQEWQERVHAGGGRVVYVAGAALHHRRKPSDARLRSLCRGAFVRGRAARRFDERRAQAPSLVRELITLGGCAGHVVRRRCPAGLVMVAHSAGRVREVFAAGRVRDVLAAGRVCDVLASRATARARAHARGSHENEYPHDGFPSNDVPSNDVPSNDVPSNDVPSNDGFPSNDDFLSGESGTVGGLRGIGRAALDAGADALQIVSTQRLRLDRAARVRPERRRVLVVGVERPERHRLAQAIRAELVRSRHDVELRMAAPGERGKFENLNLLLGERPLEDRDWLLVVDDDVVLPRGFLDRLLMLAERFGFELAQPAHAWASHAAWRVTRRRWGSVARQTQFVEIGPVTAFARATLSTLLPFPQLRMGWGLDAHWAALAREHGWRCGVIDAVAIRHCAAPAASAYPREQALAEARAFLERRPYLSAHEAQRTLATHRHW